MTTIIKEGTAPQFDNCKMRIAKYDEKTFYVQTEYLGTWMTVDQAHTQSAALKKYAGFGGK